MRISVGGMVFLIALGLRLLWVIYTSVQTGDQLRYPDEELHWGLAANLVQHGALVSDDGRYAARMPLYPLLLAPFALLESTPLPALGVILARVAQAIMGAAAVWLIHRFARDALGPRAALCAAALAAFDPYAIFFTALLLSETPFTLIGVALTCAVWRWLTRPGESALPVALLGAAAILTRPSSAGWIGLLWLIMLVVGPRRSNAAPRSATPRALHTGRPVALCVLVLALCLLPWGLRNRAVIGDFAWLSANGGVTLYDAQGPQATGASEQAGFDAIPELQGLNEAERDALLSRRARQQMLDDPGRVIELAAVKFLRTWSLWPNVAEHRTGAAAWASLLFMLLVLPAAFVGIARLWCARQRRLLALLLLPVVYFTLVHMIYIGSLRYRVPIMPFMEVLGAAAVARFSDSRPEK